MKPLNAIDAISPAFARTKLVLFSPFRFGRTWKLSVTGYLALAGAFFLPFQLVGLAFLPMARRSGGGAAVGLLIFAIAAATALFLCFFYLFARLQFSFFDIVLNRGEFVAPAWRKYGRQTWQWIGLSVAIGTLLTAVMTPALIAYARQLFSMMERMKDLQPGQPPPMDLFLGFYAGYFLLYALMFLVVIICTTIAAFIVPSLALEEVSLAEAFRRFGKFILREPGQFFGFVAMRALIGIVGYIGLIICLEIILMLQVLVVGIVALLIGLVLHLIGVPTTLLIVLGVLLAVVLYLFNMGYVMLGSFGVFVTFMQAHTLYFLGGRYALLGELLERSTPLPAFPLPYGYAPPSPPTAMSPRRQLNPRRQTRRYRRVPELAGA